MAVYTSALGYITINHKNRVVSELKISIEQPPECGDCDEFTDFVFSQVCEYLRGERVTFDCELSYDNCTDFQRRVYEQLLLIPYGKTLSYKQLAIKIGSPKSSRAVGGACNKNPLHLLIPCHRVVGSRGNLSGYAAGVEVKDFLLRLENLNL